MEGTADKKEERQRSLSDESDWYQVEATEAERRDRPEKRCHHPELGDESDSRDEGTQCTRFWFGQ